MAKDQNTEEVIVDVEEVYSKTEQYVEENKNNITIVVAALIVVVGGYFGYKNLYLAPLETEAKEQMWKAEQYFEADSFKLAINGDGQYLGFTDIADNYGSTKAGSLANYYLGVSYYQLGQYQMAIDYLADFSADDKLVAPVAKGLTGDAYMELGNTESALDFYKKAVAASSNQFTAPIYLMKAGFAAEKLGKTNDAIAFYQEIKTKYPTTNEGRGADKYLARLGAL